MLLGSRTVHAATVRAVRSQERPYAVQCALAELMCPDPLRADTPLVGANNYYAYGKGFDAAAVIRDASTIADLVGDHVVRPFGVGDEGWAPGGAADGRSPPQDHGTVQSRAWRGSSPQPTPHCVPTASPAVATQAR